MGNSRFVNIAAVLVTVVLSVFILYEASSILIPLAWAALFSLLILPVIQWLEKKKIPRFLAILLVLSMATVVLVILLYLLAVQVAGLLGDAPAVTDKISRWISDFQRFTQSALGITPEVFSQQLADSISEMIDTALRELRNSLFSVFRTLTLISLVPLYMFFMLYYRDVYYEGFMRIAKSYQEKAGYLVYKINKVLQQYLSGMLLVTLIMAVMFYIVLTLFGIDYALFFAVFLAVFNLIPYIGVFIASVAVVLYTLATMDSLFYPVAVLAALWLIQIFENNLITPYIVGSKVKLNPLVALIAILAGGSIWGVSGLVLFLPIAGALKVVFDEMEGLKPYGLLLGSSDESKKES